MPLRTWGGCFIADRYMVGSICFFGGSDESVTDLDGRRRKRAGEREGRKF